MKRLFAGLVVGLALLAGSSACSSSDDDESGSACPAICSCVGDNGGDVIECNMQCDALEAQGVSNAQCRDALESEGFPMCGVHCPSDAPSGGEGGGEGDFG